MKKFEYFSKSDIPEFCLSMIKYHPYFGSSTESLTAHLTGVSIIDRLTSMCSENSSSSSSFVSSAKVDDFPLDDLMHHRRQFSNLSSEDIDRMSDVERKVLIKDRVPMAINKDTLMITN